ncbi:hypothetical protein CLI92_11625 [Vandammella animalimorsus]|uniref:Uncharacterized protein n=1 Tax=Vandammella animalimorsus TaxID=2029117 RepID=A0A2A2T301_9BURK|nr:hypothetical protein [Vandammella animalimorsus]PAT31427.1 hypothetical protein CK626_09905 [Vandammella animalimorsus]PAX15827.1 hypothetical protein CLI92_11625 [Vandammella animalimorsus]PAX17656.1 hypothetical protein CLI93_12610 [Vandammella animalimorsus]
MKKIFTSLIIIVVGLFGFYIAYFYAWLITANPNINEAIKTRYETIASMLAPLSLFMIIIGFFIFIRSALKIIKNKKSE